MNERFVSIESPYSNTDPKQFEVNCRYALACCKHATLQGDVVYASHLILGLSFDEYNKMKYIHDEEKDIG